MLSDRRHTRLISEFGGLKSVMPRLTAAFLIITLASVGLPGLNGFVGEFLIMLGAFRWNPRFVVVAGLGVILSAVYMLWMFQRVFYGPVTNHENRPLEGPERARVGGRSARCARCRSSWGSSPTCSWRRWSRRWAASCSGSRRASRCG